MGPYESFGIAADGLGPGLTRKRCLTKVITGVVRPRRRTSRAIEDRTCSVGVTRSYSRPRVGNENPFSEARFRTLKYLPGFPAAFASLAHASEFCAGFFYEYNYIHRHARVSALRHLRRHRPGPVEHAHCQLPRPPRTVRPTAAKPLPHRRRHTGFPTRVLDTSRPGVSL
ncbi:MAG: hypothetical protein DLM58_08785 [Pseudonocardiales bacterium]|nr:MAG: hypothetical protein DLM58_08785 [Pseudonocardiales bacterium]